MAGRSLLKLKTLEFGVEAVVEQARAEYPGLSDAEIWSALTVWHAIARPEQLAPPGAWDTWLVLAGRGFGKTRIGAETVLDWVDEGWAGRLSLVAPTAADARDTMVEGESGLIACAWARGKPVKYEPSKRRVTFQNGAIATLFSAEEPDRMRGPQYHAGWGDELAAWDDPQAAWDQWSFGMRLGHHPRRVVTTTPRPIPLVRWLMDQVDSGHVVVRKGSTYDNADNLAASFLGAIERAYKDTRLGRQEIFAEVLDDNPGALWRQAIIDALRVRVVPAAFNRCALAIDPAVTSNQDSDLTGMVAGGIAPCWSFPKCNGQLHAFVVEDASNIYTPAKWAEKAAEVYRRRELDRVIGEVNNGGDLVEANLRASGEANISYRAVRASRGKEVRAEPIAALYEQGKVHHLGQFPKLEDEMTQWNPQAGMRSPSRMDALVWLLSDLMLGGSIPGVYTPPTSAARRM